MLKLSLAGLGDRKVAIVAELVAAVWSDPCNGLLRMGNNPPWIFGFQAHNPPLPHQIGARTQRDVHPFVVVQLHPTDTHFIAGADHLRGGDKFAAAPWA